VDDPIAEIPTQESKATVAGWSFLDKYIIMGHENGMLSQWNWKVPQKVYGANLSLA
jgi:translation initiation factor 3 subunit I